MLTASRFACIKIGIMFAEWTKLSLWSAVQLRIGTRRTSHSYTVMAWFPCRTGFSRVRFSVCVCSVLDGFLPGKWTQIRIIAECIVRRASQSLRAPGIQRCRFAENVVSDDAEYTTAYCRHPPPMPPPTHSNKHVWIMRCQVECEINWSNTNSIRWDFSLCSRSCNSWRVDHYAKCMVFCVCACSRTEVWAMAGISRKHKITGSDDSIWRGLCVCVIDAQTTPWRADFFFMYFLFDVVGNIR